MHVHAPTASVLHKGPDTQAKHAVALRTAHIALSCQCSVRCEQLLFSVRLLASQTIRGLQRPAVLIGDIQCKLSHVSNLKHCVCVMCWALRALKCTSHAADGFARRHDRTLSAYSVPCSRQQVAKPHIFCEQLHIDCVREVQRSPRTLCCTINPANPCAPRHDGAEAARSIPMLQRHVPKTNSS